MTRETRRKAGTRKRLSGLGDCEGAVDRDAAVDHAPAPRGPPNLDLLDRRRIAQAEVERQGALREVSGLSVVPLREGPAAGRDRDRRAEALPIRLGARERDLKEV